MKKRMTTLGLVLAAVILSGLLGVVPAEIAVAAYISIVALSATVLVLTSRPALAPVGYVSRRDVSAASHGRIVGGSYVRV